MANGKQLNKKYKLNAEHALYRKDGKWYHHLRQFPGVLFDQNGYLFFNTEDEYLNHPLLQHGQDLHTRDGIEKISGYKRFSDINNRRETVEFNLEILWRQFLENAKIYFAKDEIFLSPREQKEYKITRADENGVKIKRLSAKNSSESIGKRKFKTCIDRIKRELPVIKKGTIYEHVVEETTIVELLNDLDWSEDGLYIMYKPSNDIEVPLPEASKDNLQRANRMITLRRGQKKLREKLFQLYNGQCVFTGFSIEEVLHACHIEPHAKAGNNLSENAILLRADLHELFDAALIAINPKTYQLEVHKRLRQTEYWQYHQKPIRKRNDGKHLNNDGLSLRWKLFLKNKPA